MVALVCRWARGLLKTCGQCCVLLCYSSTARARRFRTAVFERAAQPLPLPLPYPLPLAPCPPPPRSHLSRFLRAKCRCYVPKYNPPSRTPPRPIPSRSPPPLHIALSFFIHPLNLNLNLISHISYHARPPRRRYAPSWGASSRAATTPAGPGPGAGGELTGRRRRAGTSPTRKSV